MQRVLLVDDEPGIVEVLEVILTDAGYDVRSAKNGLQAIHLANDWRPDAVLSDWMMPVMGGEELLRRLKSSPAFCTIPVIAMSALPPVAPLPLAAILQKPFPVAGMLSAIKRVLASAPLRVDRCIDGSAM